MKRIGILLSIGLMTHSSGAMGGTEDTVVRMELREGLMFKDARSPDNSLNQVTVFVELDRVQEDVSRGIVFVGDIVNNGTEAVKLADPTEFVNIYLRNPEGWTCSRKRVRPLSLIKTGHPEGTRAALDARRPFVIERMV